MATVTGRTGAVVVHHRAFPQVLRTVADVLDDGVAPRHVVVVDNSEDDEVATRLRDALPQGVRLVVTPNAGYAAAVNTGAAHLRDLPLEHLLVLTHDVRLRPGALRVLGADLDAHADLAVVGPLLLDADRADRVWSAGGALSPVLQRASHLAHGTSADAARPGLYLRDWLDGAALLYRASVLRADPLPEQYFLYVEELDHHVGLRRRGARVACDSRAVASQTTSGAPAYYRGRNGQLFQFRWGNPVGVVCAVPVEVAATVARVLLGRAPTADVREVLVGWADAWRLRLRGAVVRPSGTGWRA
jgi:GT2 family glycosyltransferase